MIIEKQVYIFFKKDKIHCNYKLWQAYIRNKQGAKREKKVQDQWGWNLWRRGQRHEMMQEGWVGAKSHRSSYFPQSTLVFVFRQSVYLCVPFIALHLEAPWSQGMVSPSSTGHTSTSYLRAVSSPGKPQQIITQCWLNLLNAGRNRKVQVRFARRRRA